MTNYADTKLETGFILPFATLAASKLGNFTKNMEMAAILYLAESSREKGEGHILRKPDEKIVFITEACYPIWLIPHNGATLVFDGLGIASHTLSYDTIPNIEIFEKSIRETQKATEAYAATLARSTDYFESFSGKEEKTIEALVASPDLIKDFTIYLSQTKETTKPLTKVVLTPTISNSQIQVALEQLSNLRKRIYTDIENVDASMKLLNSTTLERTKAIQEEIKKIQEKHDIGIEKIKPKVTREIWQIQSKYDRKINGTSKRFEKRLQRLEKNQARLQKALKHLRTEAKQCERRIQSSKRRKKKQTANRWSLKLKRIKSKLPILQKEIKETIKRMHNIEAAQKHELAQQKTECDTHIEATKKTLDDLQASNEAEMTLKRQEIDTLQCLTSRIIDQMCEVAKTRKLILEEFNTITMPEEKQAHKLVYIPFYLVRYEKEDKKRYLVYPPSTISDMGIVTKMKGALGAARTKVLLQSRSRAMTAFLNQLVTLIERNPMLEKKVTEECIKESILLKKQLRIGVKKGLRELKNENWISEKELQTLSKLLYTYA